MSYRDGSVPGHPLPIAHPGLWATHVPGGKVLARSPEARLAEGLAALNWVDRPAAQVATCELPRLQGGECIQWVTHLL